jgi:hypothetical protein
MSALGESESLSSNPSLSLRERVGVRAGTAENAKKQPRFLAIPLSLTLSQRGRGFVVGLAHGPAFQI